MKTIAAIADIHGNILALEGVISDMRRRKIDVVVNLGDHLSGPLWPKETAKYLMQQNWVQISGNNDRELIQQEPEKHGLSNAYAFGVIGDKEKEWLKKLPACVRMDNDTLLVHGTPFSDSEYLLETVEHGRVRLASQNEIIKRIGNTTASLILCGHTHSQRAVRVNDILIVNPGSVGLPAYEDDSPKYHINESGSPDARYAILKYDGNKWSAQLISIQYDFQKAVKQAKKNNRADWAIALETGYMRR